MQSTLDKFTDLPIISRPRAKILIDAKTMESLIDASKEAQFDLIGVYIEPKAAEALLSINSKNRPLTEANVERLVDQINSHNWGLSNDMIVVSAGENPYLLNGQNRCNAIIRSGIPVLVDIRFGADPKSFLSMDKGKRRTPGDDLFVHASQRDNEIITKNALLISQAVRFLLGYFEYDCDFRIAMKTQDIIGKTYETFFPVYNFIDDARAMSLAWGGSVYQYAAVRYMMEISEPSAARELWNAVRSQENLTRDTPEMRISRRFTLINGLVNRYERSADLIIGFNQKIGAEKVGRNALIEYARFTPKTYPRIMKPDGSTLTMEDFPKLLKPVKAA